MRPVFVSAVFVCVLYTVCPSIHPCIHACMHASIHLYPSINPSIHRPTYVNTCKLENYGIRNTQLNWFSSYFEGRLQYVYCRGARFALRTILHGVPQGSNLGPLLFFIYINDLPNVSNSLFFILFADDTNVFFSHKSLDTLFQIVNTELELVAEWFSDNRLTVNLDKTNYILFKSHRKTGSSHGHHKICINSISLSRVSSTRFLGVYVDQHLDWKVT